MFVNIQFFSVQLISDIEPKWHWLGDRAYHYCWRLVEQSPIHVFFDCKQLRRFFWKKNWITNSILFANALWLVLFNRRMIRFRPAFFSASTQTPSRCMVFYGTLISKVDVNTCIEFESWLWKNSGALCQVSNGLAQSPAIFLARIFFSACSGPVVWSHKNYSWCQIKNYDCLKIVIPKFLIQCLSTFSPFGLFISVVLEIWPWLNDIARSECWRFAILNPLVDFTRKF